MQYLMRSLVVMVSLVFAGHGRGQLPSRNASNRWTECSRLCPDSRSCWYGGEPRCAF